MSSADAAFMRRALRLAERGRGKVSPNPLVGAVVVRRGRVVGEGAHLELGGHHAEVHAFAAAGERAREATLFVTLEPCAHQGRTPPCIDTVLRSGVRRLVCAMEDPDERVRGEGLARLREAGLDVEVGLLGAKAERQNAAYLKHRRTGLPLVILKLAQTLDGRIATVSGESRWITGAASRRHVHRWRSWVDGIAVGAGTVLADDPRLTVRHVRGRNPRRLVVDGRLRVSPEARIFHPGDGAILVTSRETPKRKRAAFTAGGTAVWTFSERDGSIDLKKPLMRAAREGMTSLLIEGGPQLAASALRQQVVDQVMIYVAPALMGEGMGAIGDLGVQLPSEVARLEGARIQRLGADFLITGEVSYSCSPD